MRWGRRVIVVMVVALGVLAVNPEAGADPGLRLGAERATLGPGRTSVELAGFYSCGPFATGRPDRGVIDMTVEQMRGGRTVSAFGFLEPTVCDGTDQPFAVTLTGTGGKRFRSSPATWLASGYVEGDTGVQFVHVPPTPIALTR